MNSQVLNNFTTPNNMANSPFIKGPKVLSVYNRSSTDTLENT